MRMGLDRRVNERTAVIGAGVMGSRIGYALALAGASVEICDIDPSAARAAADLIRSRAETAGVEVQVREGHVEELDASITLVVEAVSEDLAVKATVLRAVGLRAPAAVIATNSSTYQASELASYVPDPTLLLVAHFFNPADIVPLVEIVPSQLTSETALERVIALLVRAGKKPVVLGQEIEGFVANRLQAALIREACHLVEKGVVTAEALDEVVRTSLGPRWAAVGPLRVADLGGLDVFRALCDRLLPTLDTRQAAPDLLVRLERLGLKGAKSGSGIYEYSPGMRAEWEGRITAAFATQP